MGKNAVVMALVLLAGSGCDKQVCQCAVLVGGTTPESHEEEERRQKAVEDCLAAHGGGTIHGCPMPPSMQERRGPRVEPAPAPAPAPAPTP